MQPTVEEIRDAWNKARRAIHSVITNEHYDKKLDAMLNDAFSDCMRDAGIAEDEIWA
jgi:hypothetical protein